jgi:hypothetical protein
MVMVRIASMPIGRREQWPRSISSNKGGAPIEIASISELSFATTTVD